MELNKEPNILYSLYKMAFLLERKEKENFIAGVDVALKKISNREMVKTAAGAHNPETAKDMEDLVSALEKYVSIDGNIDYSNIGVFITPMSVAARKLALRPYKLIGIVRKLQSLSRDYKKENKKKGNKRVVKTIKKDFDANLEKIKMRLTYIKKASSFGALQVDKVASDVDNADRMTERFVSNIENMLRTSNLTIHEVADLLSSDMFSCVNKKQVLAEIKKIDSIDKAG